MQALDSVPRKIGPYRLVEKIGEGGMGSVYMAQQTEPVKRVVAVKVIRAGMDSKAVLARVRDRNAVGTLERMIGQAENSR